MLKADAASAIAIALQADGDTAQPHAFCDTALEVTEGARKIAQGRAYQDGLVELQDAASQAVVAALELQPGMRVLDYCAGGGGKSLALAAFNGVQVFAHDVNAARMRDLPARAKRAGARVKILTSKELDEQEPFDIVLADAPCSGSGSWRRAPAGKWALTEERLQDLTQIQSGILQNTTALVRKGGVFAYATCSVLTDENGAIVDSFLARNPEWAETFRKSWQVAHGSDGFFHGTLDEIRLGQITT